MALGALASVGYVVLLEKTADDVASGNRDVLTKLKGDARFAMPVLLIAAVALKNYIANPDAVKMLNLIPKDDFATAMLGFVAPSRLPLLYREIRASVRGDDLLDMLPGSVGQGRQILRSMRDSGASEVESDETNAPSLTRIVVVSGPSCLGKTTLVNKIIAEDRRLAKPAWCTTRPLRSTEVEGGDLSFVKQVKFEELERDGAFLETYKDDNGESYGLRLKEILAVGERGKVRRILAFAAIHFGTIPADTPFFFGKQVYSDKTLKNSGLGNSLSSCEHATIRSRVVHITSFCACHAVCRAWCVFVA